MNELLENIKRLKAECEAKEKERPKIAIFHDRASLLGAVRSQPAPELLAHPVPTQFDGIALVADPTIAKEPGKVVLSSDADFARAVVERLREEGGYVFKA
jgi:hypothetical protein